MLCMNNNSMFPCLKEEDREKEVGMTPNLKLIRKLKMNNFGLCNGPCMV